MGGVERRQSFGVSLEEFPELISSALIPLSVMALPPKTPWSFILYFQQGQAQSTHLPKSLLNFWNLATFLPFHLLWPVQFPKSNLPKKQCGQKSFAQMFN